MHLQIGPVSLAPFEHSADVSIRPKLDDTGLDVLWYEVTASMVCVWSPFATATATAPVAPAPGDNLGVTVRNLRTVLMQPKQQITLTIGPDRCFTSPLSGPFAVGPILPCDPMGGPFIDDVQILSIAGDKAATVLVRVRFAYNDDNHIVLSNRWTVRSATDATSWLTTRVTTGKAVLRMDFLQQQNNANLDPTIVPDQFRNAFILPCPQGFMRKSVDVTATPDGAQLGYTVVDKQMRLNLGNGGSITKVRGDVTVGADFPFKLLQTAPAGQMAAGLAGLTQGIFGSGAAGFAINQVQWWSGAFATPKAKVVVQVTGTHTTNYADLAGFAAFVAADRLSPVGIGPPGGPVQFLIVSNYMTETFDADGAPLVQVAMEVLPLGANAIAALMNPQNVSVLLNTTTDIGTTSLVGPALGGALAASANPAFGNPRLPSSQNTRGTYVAMMVSQVLAMGSVPAGNYVPVGGTPGDGVPVRADLALA